MFTKSIKKPFNFTLSKTQKATILQSSTAGKKAGKLFCQLDRDCAELSKRTGIPSSELMSKTLNLAKTTTLNFDEAFRAIERIVLEYTNQPTLSDIAYQYANETNKTLTAWYLWKEAMFRILNQPYRHMWE